MQLVTFDEVKSISRQPDTIRRVQSILEVSYEEANEWIERELRQMEESTDEQFQQRSAFDPTWPERKAQRDKNDAHLASVVAEEIRTGAVDLRGVLRDLETLVHPGSARKRKRRKLLIIGVAIVALIVIALVAVL